MSRIIVPGKSAHPDFALPGRRPRGPVKIDWTHPAARGLTNFYLFGGQYGIGRCLITGASAYRVSGVSIYPDRVVSGGTGIDDSIRIPLRSAATAKSCGVMVTRRISGSVGWSLLYQGSNGWNGFFADTGAQFYITQTSDFAGSVIPTSGGPPPIQNQLGAFSVAWRVNGSNDARASLNGGPVATDTAFTIPSLFGSEIVIGCAKQLGYDNQAVAECWLAAFWAEGYLSNEDLRAVSGKPWQLLKPANAPVFFLPSSTLATIPVLSAATVLNITGTTATPRVTVTY